MNVHFEMICPECLRKVSEWKLCNDYGGELVLTKKPISKKFPFVRKNEQMVERFTIVGTCATCSNRIEASVCRTIENSKSHIDFRYEPKMGIGESRSFLKKERDLYEELGRKQKG